MRTDARSALAHQFEDLPQQHEAVTLGMWLFLITEIMFFGGLFAAYGVYRSTHPQAWHEGSLHLDVVLGGVNTAVLITSSLTMALAVRAAQIGKRKELVLFLVLTMLFGAAFLGIKAFEYAHKFEAGLVPGVAFTYNGANAPQLQLFFLFYFIMTGMHALHMVIGLGVMTVLVVLAARGRLLGDFHKPVEVAGLYWHFVDIVWIFLFPLLYLIGRHA
jgi:cytochrome c oxidase subunit 3